MRRMRRRSFGRRRASVAWIPGLSGYDTALPTFDRALTLLSQAPVAANTWAVPVAAVTPTDLSLHGGEDAVLQRMRGRILCVNGRINLGAGLVASTFPLRVLVTLAQSDASGIFALDYTTSVGLGRDEILWTGETICSQGTIRDSDPPTAVWQWLEVDVRAKRRMQESALVVFWFQTVLPVGTTAADFRLVGGVRSLLKRPR